MLQHPKHSHLRLFTPDDISGLTPVHLPEQAIEACRAIVAWTYEYLCQPHPDLGRPGPVCPATPQAIDAGTYWLAVVDEDAVDGEAVARLVGEYVDWYEQLPPREGDVAELKAVVLVFPWLREEAQFAALDALQARLKDVLVTQGLMLGQFHRCTLQPGVWNEAFRPLRAPHALLAIRRMVPGDWRFLTAEEHLTEYVRHLGDRIPERDVAALAPHLERAGLARP